MRLFDTRTGRILEKKKVVMYDLLNLYLTSFIKKKTLKGKVRFDTITFICFLNGFEIKHLGF